MPDELTTTGIAAAIYGLGRMVEGSLKKLFGMVKKAEDNRIKDKELARASAQFTEIQRELKLMSEAHIVSQVALAKISTRQEDMLRRIGDIETNIKDIKRRTDRVDT